MEIENSIAIVTGGASGMGEATARQLGRLGAKVAIIDMNQAAAEKIATEIKGAAFSADVTQVEQIENVMQAIQKKWGTPHICVNCAGILHSRRMVNQQGLMPLAEFRRVIEINLIGTFNVMQIAAQAMMTQPARNESGERGVIINTASIAGYEGQIGQTAYSASKGGVISLTLPAARELAQFGIRVMTIAPGLVDTPMFTQLSAEVKASLSATVPFPKRLAQPEEYAALVVHIILNEMLNGTVIRLDGALRMAPK